MDSAAISLIVVGAGVFLAGLLGGDVEMWKIRVPKISTRGKRTVVAVLGAVLFLIGVWHSLTPTPEDPSKNPTVGPSGGPEVATPKSTEAPEQEALASLSGSVSLPPHTDTFSKRHGDYSITVIPESSREIISGRIDTQGHFRVNGVPKETSLTVSWTISKPGELILWPPRRSDVRFTSHLRVFQVQALDNVFGNAKREMTEAIRARNFDRAAERLSQILQLFERLGIDGEWTDNCTVQKIRRWRFTIHRDLVDVADEARTSQGATADQVETEGQWRRRMIIFSLRQPDSDESLRDFARSVNSWAAYSREVFSRRQRSWPDRSLASRTDGNTDLLQGGVDEELLLSDIALVVRQLQNPQVRALITEFSNDSTQMAQLKEGQRLAIESFTSLIERNPEQISLNRLMNLLSALQRIAELWPKVGDGEKRVACRGGS